jgi:hypothetical protein
LEKGNSVRRRTTRSRAVGLLRAALEEAVGERWDVFPSLCQRWQADDAITESVSELAEED